MTNSANGPSLESALLIEEACERFEAEWKAGRRPRLADYLGNATDSLFPHLLQELVLLDVHYRQQIGETLCLEDYRNYYSTSAPPWLTALLASTDQPQHIGRYRIEKILGEGGFGRVYLAHDDQLERPVAIKVPRPERLSGPGDAEAYLAEARVVASLDHANIVPVHDVGTTGNGSCYVVSKFIEGSDLAARLRETRLTPTRAAELVATVAEALHYAHRKGLVHRDIKPGNILLDAGGKPYIADFGLALKEASYGQGPGFAGTPAYMSPEQARGEGHRVDGRSDIFSLGAVFYQALTGRRPFQGQAQSELLDAILRDEARPPRQVDDNIPKELERICLKALSKRATERYTTAQDMAGDLRHYLAYSSRQQLLVVQGNTGATFPPAGVIIQTATPPTTPVTPGASSSEQRPIKIVPKGLRSFDAADADFFLELLPGPRDRDGLPESIRFWKSRIEDPSTDHTFAVGLIYGPSGCGKSSLVKAGLLPRLADHVMSVYVEATSADTGARLLKGIRKRCPDLPANLGLTQTLAALRRGHGIPAGKTVLIVLDQFEQWLHARRAEHDTELATALRHCDGERVQCVVMVRDDFWLAVSRFMADLEVELVQGRNMALVDLFDSRHSGKVLAAFGRAFGVLPDKPAAMTANQEAFLTQAVAGLSQDGRIISVRLALFAEMVKAKPWTPATLKEVGGIAGVGVTFLEETFSAPSAAPRHRLHTKAAQAVLRALLPETGTDIKGQMRSLDELMHASGYTGRARDFEELMRILDGELRLVTPTEPEEDSETARQRHNETARLGEGETRRQGDKERGTEVATASSVSLSPPLSVSVSRFYQLTHDYLVPSLRDWLTRKQKETRKGRAELRLAERAAAWNAKPESRHLPAWWEWASIRLFTRKRDWTTVQKKMMDKANRFHAWRGMGLALVLVMSAAASLVVFNLVQQQRNEDMAHGLVGQLLKADIAKVPDTISEIDRYRLWADPLLQAENAKSAADGPQRLHTSLALLRVDPGQLDYLYGRLLEAAPRELPVIRASLAAHRDKLIKKLWTVAEQPPPGLDQQRLRAACALASYDPDSSQWPKVSEAVVRNLLLEPAPYLPEWMESLRPVRLKLLPALAAVFPDGQRGELERSLATDVLVDFARDQPAILANVVMDADQKSFLTLYPRLKANGKQAADILQAELDRRLEPQWVDAPLDQRWTQPDPALVKKIEAAHGLINERIAFCQTMALEDFLAVAEALRLAGYRPIRFRPYSTTGEPPASGNRLLVAAVWTRDDQEWQLAHDLTAEAMMSLDTKQRERLFHPVDVAGYVTDDQELYAGLWVKVAPNSVATALAVALSDQELQTHALAGAAMAVALSKNDLQAKDFTLRKEGYWRAATSLVPVTKGPPRVAAIWTKPASREPPERNVSTDSDFFGNEADYSGDNFLADVQVDAAVGITRQGDSRYAAIWHPLPDWTSIESHGLDPTQHLARAKELLGQGYRPVAWSVAQPAPSGPRVTASVWHRPIVPAGDKEKIAKRQANAAVALFKMGQPDEVWRLFKHQPDPRVRSYLIHRLSPLGADPRALLRRLEQEQDVSSRRAYLLALGDFTDKQLPLAERAVVVPQLLAWYRNDPDAGLHGAVAWLLTKWGYRQEIKKLDKEFSAHQKSKIKNALSPTWFVNGQVQSFTVIPGDVDFVMGSPRAEAGRQDGPQGEWEFQHKKSIARTYAIATHEVTVEQFLRFRKNHQYDRPSAPTADCPVNKVTWYNAAEYCNWLSKEEGIPEDEWCYEKNAKGQYAEGMKPKPNYLHLTGYRLPTEAEWEYACRARAASSRHYGETEDLLENYAWNVKNSRSLRTLPVGSLKPNDLGLFDMLGNASEWTHDIPYYYVPGKAGRPIEDQERVDTVVDAQSRVFRGGSFTTSTSTVRSAMRYFDQPNIQYIFVGFRPARTLDAGELAN
jgi:serine/threonine protein kinase/formylglycine-generating enzyme required for sulfatase activity